MLRRIVIPRIWLSRLLSRLAERPDRALFCQTGFHFDNERISYLIRSPEPAYSVENMVGRCFCLSTVARPVALSDVIKSLDGMPCDMGYLILGMGMATGLVWGFWREKSGDIAPIEEIILVGHQMPVIPIQPEGVAKAADIAPDILHRWSRTIGALGISTWKRLHELTICVIGCGRSGSVAAVTLARMGVSRLILIDPDKLEAHNLPEMDGVGENDIGKFKVDAVASFLQSHCASPLLPINTTPLPQTIVAAYREALHADILLCCVDNSTARLACGILATLYHKVLVDISTGILPAPHMSGSVAGDSHESRQSGADVRLLVPGYECLCCLGGITDYHRAVQELAHISSPDQEFWWVERAGSLRTLNMIAVHLGLQMLCDFLDGRIQQSRWIQLEYDGHGRIDFHTTEAQESQSSCNLCIKAGMGDDGLRW